MIKHSPGLTCCVCVVLCLYEKKKNTSHAVVLVLLCAIHMTRHWKWLTAQLHLRLVSERQHRVNLEHPGGLFGRHRLACCYAGVWGGTQKSPAVLKWLELSCTTTVTFTSLARWCPAAGLTLDCESHDADGLNHLLTLREQQ